MAIFEDKIWIRGWYTNNSRIINKKLNKLCKYITLHQIKKCHKIALADFFCLTKILQLCQGDFASNCNDNNLKKIMHGFYYLSINFAPLNKINSLLYIFTSLYD